MSTCTVTCLGEAMVEISLDGSQPDLAGIGFAGDTFNTAIYLKRQAPDVQVAYATKLGRDRLSERLLELMRSENLSVDLVAFSDTEMPGLYAISTDAAGERSFMYWRTNSAARTMFQAPGVSFDALAASDLLYFSAISLAILPSQQRAEFLGWLPQYRAQGGKVVFDSNYRPALWSDVETARRDVTTAWGLTDIGFPSVDDEMALFGDPDADAVLQRLNALGVRSGALKRGEKGPISLDGSEAGTFNPVGRVIDSTAAGDSFNGAYLAALLQGCPQAECLRAGHDMASRVISVKGAILPREPSRK